jgi:predicted nucleotide-binding protein (sugar kinase/HSP70/actin superfamily)
MPAVAIAGGAIRILEQERLDPEKTFLYLPTVCMACNYPQFPLMAGMAVRDAGLQGLKVAPINFLNPGGILPGMLGVRLFETSVVASLLYKLYHRIRPYEKQPGAAAKAFDEAEQMLLQALRQREGLRTTFGRVAEMFRAIERDETGPRKPRIAILGDMYVKYNDVVNQDVTGLIEELGGELVVPSLTDMTCHFLDVDARAGLERPNAVKTLQTFEARYEKLAADLLGETREPEWEACAKLLEEQGISPRIAGETSINVARALYLLSHKQVDAIVHLNPMFCCPGVVSASLFRRLQADFSVPIIDIFYDGTGDPNRILIPHLSFLKAREREA